MRFAPKIVAIVLFVLWFPTARGADAYSILTHEAIVDAVWDDRIVPLLRTRFRGISADELVLARSFAYGGSIVQDLGYYPFGSRLFSNLLHYTRSGDFVAALVRDARDVNEYAFGLGALAHYASDNVGHPEAVNVAVPLHFPKLRAKYGRYVTYAEGRTQHVRVEFSFDVVQAAGDSYLQDAYRRFIGFRVAESLLERAFRETYGLSMNDVFVNRKLAIGTYRYAVSQVFPAITAAAWKSHRDELLRRRPDLSRGEFVFAYKRADYEREYGLEYQKPGIFARFLGLLYRVVPKIGPLKAIDFKAPTPESERLFVESMRETVARFGRELSMLAHGRARPDNTNFDTGRPARYGDYELADETYGNLVGKLVERGLTDVSPALRQSILAFYAGATPPPAGASKKALRQWAALQQDLRALAETKRQP
jgi:hypothetical protein